jgi:hypothetical protein
MKSGGTGFEIAGGCATVRTPAAKGSSRLIAILYVIHGAPVVN